MRAYFTVMQKAIRTNQGLVLHYVGDQVGAVFGVPLRHDDHADRAVLAALEMRKSPAELNWHRIREENPPLDTASGFVPGVLAGNTGSEDRLSYVLIGGRVNLGSRIQECVCVCQ